MSTTIVVSIIAVALVAGLGVFIFYLMKRSRTIVPDMTDRKAAEKDQVVAVDDQGRAVMESEDVSPEEPRDVTAFESVLGEELKDLHPDGEQ